MVVSSVLDARKSLNVLQQEWYGCTACTLGERREAVQGSFVFGEGSPGGLMFIGEGPGWQEEKEGRPFVGKSGKLLRDILNAMNITNHYISNIVACRSCAEMIDEAGNVVMSRGFGGKPPEIRYIDQTPTKQQIEACRARLNEEIYIVDPKIIIALGATAAETLARRSFKIGQDHGQPEEIDIPGVAWQPKRTNKGVWARKVKGEFVMPTEQNKVRYLMISTWHPAFVLRKINEEGPHSPFAQLTQDIRKAADVYDRYMFEVCGVNPSQLYRASYQEIQEQILEEEEREKEPD